MSGFASPGKSLWDALQQCLQLFKYTPSTTTIAREVIWGVLPDGTCVGGMTVDNLLAHTAKLLAESKRVYRWQDTLCWESEDPQNAQLQVLATRQKAEPGAVGLVSNLFCVGVEDKTSSQESLPSSKLINAVLANEDLWRQVPEIKHYARRAVYDADFNLCGPGWHPDKGILVHGPEVEPILPEEPVQPPVTAFDHLPHFTRELLREFCWRDDADLVNALALLLTGFLSNHFVDDPHPVGVIDGNQPGLGKTSLIQAIGRVLDGVEPPRIPLVKDEELEKKLCAHLREGRSSIFFLDNVRNNIESALLEANVLSPLLSFRLLGGNVMISRPNAYLWVVTSNVTSGTSDFLRRGLPIRLHHEGDPKKRHFVGNPVEFASQHRLEILGELAGLVERWKQQGRPEGQPKHRCRAWAKVIGGILAVNGFDQFLGNLDEAEAAMDEGLLGLATLAEFVVSKGKTELFTVASGDANSKGQPAREWTKLFTEAEVGQAQLATRSGKGQHTWVGQFLSGKIDRTVEVTTQMGIGTATLRMREGRSKQKLYFFEVALTTDGVGEPIFAGGLADLGMPHPPTPGAAPGAGGKMLPQTGAGDVPPAGEQIKDSSGNQLDWS